MSHTSIDKEDYSETLEEVIAANLKEHSLYVISICVVVLSEVNQFLLLTSDSLYIASSAPS